MKAILPKISIITPSFNQGSFIKETIDSVLNQKYPNLEYWVIDGGSSDETIKILKRYGSKINWISEKDAGQTDALNKGISTCSGEIFGYINSDDVYAPNTFFEVANTFMKYPGALWVSGEYQIIDADGNEIQSFVRLYKSFFRFLNIPHLFYILNYINQPSTFWRRSAFKKVGIFDQSLRFCMDYDFWLRLYTQKGPLFIPTVLSKFRIHQASKGGAQYTKQFEEELTIIKRYTKDPVTVILHSLHSFFIVQIYKFLK